MKGELITHSNDTKPSETDHLVEIEQKPKRYQYTATQVTCIQSEKFITTQGHSL